MSIQSDHDKVPDADEINLVPINDPPVKRPAEDPRLELEDGPYSVEPEPEPPPPEIDSNRLSVPNSTNYRCANCDYILAGLTSRRCPECGEPFTINQALMHGLESSTELSVLHSAMRRDSVKFYAGVFMLIAAFMGPNIRGGASLPSTPMSFRGWSMLIFMFPLLFFTAYVRQSGDHKWSDMILIAGVIALTVGLLLTLL